MILKVPWSLIIIAILEDISIEGPVCIPNMKNLAVYEGYENVLMNLTTDTNNVKWSCIPSSDEFNSFNIQDSDGSRDSSLIGLFYPNQSGLVILNATTTPNGQKISTAGLYIAQCANSTNRTGAKLLVVRRAPECSCNASSPTNVTLSCTIFDADGTLHPIYANMTWKIGDIIYTTDTPPRTRRDYYVFESTSTIIITVDSYSLPANFTCTVTFNAPTDIQYPYIATNAPEFSASCTVAVCGGALSTTERPATTLSPTTTTSSIAGSGETNTSPITTTQASTTTWSKPANQSPIATGPKSTNESSTTTTPPTRAFWISMEPLFGPVAGGTNITIIGSATFEYLSKYVGFNVTGVRNVYIGKDLSSTTVSLLTIGSATFEFVAVTPNTTEESIGQTRPVIIEFSPTPFNMTFNTTFTYLPNPGITAIYPNIFIASGGTMLDVFGRSLSSVAKPIIQLTVVITRGAENNSSSTTSTTSTSRVCTVPKGNDTYMQCPMPPLNISDGFLEILNSLYNISTSRRRRSRTSINQPNANSHSHLSRLKRDTNVLTMVGRNGIDRADIYLGFILDGYKKYENINDALPFTKFIFYSAPEIKSSNKVIEFDPSEDELIYVKGRYMLRGCLLRDYVVHIGNQICTNSDLQDNQLTCRPPKEKPSSTGNDSLHCGQHLSIAITVGYKQYQYACLTYTDNSKTFALIVGLTVGLSGFALFLTILIACIVRCRRNKVLSQETYRHQDTGGHELRNPHYNSDVEPESHQDYMYARQNTISLYTPNDEYLTSIDEFESSS